MIVVHRIVLCACIGALGGLSRGQQVQLADQPSRGGSPLDWCVFGSPVVISINEQLSSCFRGAWVFWTRRAWPLCLPTSISESGRPKPLQSHIGPAHLSACVELVVRTEGLPLFEGNFNGLMIVSERAP